MDIPITQFRQKIFELVNQALDGKEVWVSHRGKRVRLVPEHAPSKLDRLTPMEIIVPGADIEDDSWKTEAKSEWEQKWERKLGKLSKPAQSVAGRSKSTTRKTRRTA